MNNSELFEFQSHMTEDERALTLKLSFAERLIISVALIVAVIWGTLMKLFIYYNLWQEKLSKRPINVLILLDQLIDHFTKVFAALNAIILLITNWPTPVAWKILFGIDLKAREACIGYSIFSYILSSYATVGSLGIAIYRVLYIKATHWVKFKAGETPLLIMICICIFGATGFVSLSTGAGTAAGSATFNRCLGQTTVIEEIYQLYTVGEVVHDTVYMKLYPIIITALQVMELLCYISLYNFVCKHDEEMSQLNVISRDAFYRRKQKNLFSMYAQVLSFALEVLYFIFLLCMRIIGRSFSLITVREYADALYITQFGLTSTIQVFASSDLRLKFLTMVGQVTQ